MGNTIETYLLGATSPYTLLPPAREHLESPVSSCRVSEATSAAAIFASRTTSAEMPAIRIDESLTEEDREAREKGFALVARIEHFAQVDEGFQRWLQVGLDQAASGDVVTFSENGWEE